MKKYDFVGYIDNNLANTFLIPIFKSEEEFFFQAISEDNNDLICSFDFIKDKRIEEHLRYINYNNAERVVGNSAIYLFRFNLEIFIGAKGELLSGLKRIYEQFDHTKNTFFMRELMSLFTLERTNCLKYFFHLNYYKYEEFDDLVFFMSIIFSVPEKAINKELNKIQLRPYVYGRKGIKEIIKARQERMRKKLEMLRYTNTVIQFNEESNDKEYYSLE